MSRSKEKATSNLSVIVPYKDFEKLLESGKQIERMENQYKQLEEKYNAMMEIYREILDKVAEINRYL